MCFNDRFTCSIMVKGITKFGERVPFSEQHLTYGANLTVSGANEGDGECSAAQVMEMSEFLNQSE